MAVDMGLSRAQGNQHHASAHTHWPQSGSSRTASNRTAPSVAAAAQVLLSSPHLQWLGSQLDGRQLGAGAGLCTGAGDAWLKLPTPILGAAEQRQEQKEELLEAREVEQHLGSCSGSSLASKLSVLARTTPGGSRQDSAPCGAP